MACFIVPGVEAVATTIVTKIIERRENKLETHEGNKIISGEQNREIKSLMEADKENHKEKLSVKLKRLNGLLWGGSALLAFEHLWHGEIKPFFPFLTAAENPGELTEVLHEMSTVGVGMAVLVTVVWAISNVVLGSIDKRSLENYSELQNDKEGENGTV